MFANPALGETALYVCILPPSWHFGSDNQFLFEHDLFGKPVSTFPDHALDSSRRPYWKAVSEKFLSLRECSRSIGMSANFSIALMPMIRCWATCRL
jgi:hypothetical protein